MELTNSKENNDLKNLIWLYLLLLIFEGALRKWFFPSLTTPLLLIREPIVIWLVLVGLQKGWLKNSYIIIMIIVSSLLFISSLLFGHQNLMTALYGWRIYAIHFPFIFIIGKLLNREDILKMGRVVLYLSIPMTLLIVAQFHLPQSSWANRGVGGDMDGAGFSGAMGYFRPPGTFSFTSGYVLFQLLVACFLFYYLLVNKSLPKQQQIKSWLLWLAFSCYILSIPYSISRTYFFQTFVVIGFLLTGSLLGNNALRKKVLLSIPIFIFLTVIVLLSGIADDSIMAFTSRLESASYSEGGFKGTLGKRYIGSFIRGLLNEDAPFWGNNLGLGTSVGATLAGGTNGMFSFFNGEDEWVRITNESGLLPGWIIIGIRLSLSLSIAIKAYQSLRKKKDLLPWMLASGMLLTLPQTNLGVPTNLGFCMLLAGFSLAVIKTPINKSES